MSDTATDLVHVVPPAPSLSFAYSPQQTGQWMAKLQEYRRAVLVEGPDYGTIGGIERPTLLKPGAEKLLLAAGLGFTIHKVDDEDSRTHQGVTYRCTIRRGDQIVAECDGYAGYDESRYYTSAADAEAKERGNAAKYQRPVNKAKFVEYRAPWNTVMKMSQKRALVGATLNALAASGIFTQDLEDEQPVAPAAPFDPMQLLGPYLSRLNSDSNRELREWRRSSELPSPKDMNIEQAGRALVKIGALLAAQDLPASPPSGSAGVEPVQESTPPGPAPSAANSGYVSKKQAQRAHIIAKGLDDSVLRPLIWAGTDGRSDSADYLLASLYEQTCEAIERAAAEGLLPDDWDQIQAAYEQWRSDQSIQAAEEARLAQYEADMAGEGE